jgi:hypothetical protein
MRSPLRIAAWSAGIVAVIASLTVLPPLWQYWSWYPKVWSASILVDAKAASKSCLYADRSRQRFLIVRNEPTRVELYYVGSVHADRFVWRCEDAAFSFLPGLAFSNHVQFGRGCLAENVVVEDQEGKVLSPTRTPVADLRVGAEQ